MNREFSFWPTPAWAVFFRASNDDEASRARRYRSPVLPCRRVEGCDLCTTDKFFHARTGKAAQPVAKARRAKDYLQCENLRRDSTANKAYIKLVKAHEPVHLLWRLSPISRQHNEHPRKRRELDILCANGGPGVRIDDSITPAMPSLPRGRCRSTPPCARATAHNAGLPPAKLPGRILYGWPQLRQASGLLAEAALMAKSQPRRCGRAQCREGGCVREENTFAG